MIRRCGGRLPTQDAVRFVASWEGVAVLPINGGVGYRHNENRQHCD